MYRSYVSGAGTLVHFYHSSNTKQYRIKVFLTIFADDGAGSVVLVTNGSGCGSGRPKTFGSYGSAILLCK
jgi:hypothetical protein